MLRPSPATRRVLGLALAVSVGTGIGFGAYSLGSAAGADSSYFPRVGTATTPPTTTPGEPGNAADTSTAATPAAPLTLEQATAVALRFGPGRVVEVDEDHEPTGLRYDVTLLHDNGTATEVEVDTVTGQVTSTTFHDDWDGS